MILQYTSYNVCSGFQNKLVFCGLKFLLDSDTRHILTDILFKNTVVRIPSPSCVENLRISNTFPVILNISITCSCDDLILQFISKLCKVGCVTRNSDGQSAVLLWILLCCEQVFFSYYVKLDMWNLKIYKCS